MISTSNLPLATRLPFLWKRPLGFASLPRGRFAFVQDARKYTRGKELVAISLIVASHDAQKLMGVPVERYGATPSRSYLPACWSNLSMDLSLGFFKAHCASLGRKNPTFGSGFLRRDALALPEHGSPSRYLKSFVHTWH